MRVLNTRPARFLAEAVVLPQKLGCHPSGCWVLYNP